MHFRWSGIFAVALLCCAAAVGRAQMVAPVVPVTAVAVRVDDTVLVVTLNNREVLVGTEVETTITLNGAAAKLSDIKEGQRVVITQVDGLTRKIDAFTKKGTI